MTIDTWPSEAGSPIFVRGYHGKTYESLIEAFHQDAVLLLQQGYEPAGQHYIDGRWSATAAVIATILIPVFFIGVVLWLYMLASRPTGTLTVTYLHRAA